MSAYRVNFDDNQGFTDVVNWPLTFAFGVGDRAEMFGSWMLVSRIDRDIRPLFLPLAARGRRRRPRLPARAPGLVRQPARRLSGLARKINLTVAVAPAAGRASPLRGMIKLPTGEASDEGVGTGKADFAFDAIVSKEINQRVEVSGYGGVHRPRRPGRVRPDQRLPLGLRRRRPDAASHCASPRNSHGEKYFNDSVTYTGTGLIGDRRVVPAVGFDRR